MARVVRYSLGCHIAGAADESQVGRVEANAIKDPMFMTLFMKRCRRVIGTARNAFHREF